MQGYTKVNAYFEHYNLQLWSDFTFFENSAIRGNTLGDQFEQLENRNLLGGSFVKGFDHTLLGLSLIHI